MLRYLIKRVFSIFLGIVIAVAATIYVANWGGKLDEVILQQLELEISQQILVMPGIPEEVKRAYIAEQLELYKRALGFDKPFFPDRFFIYLYKYLTLDFGRSFFIIAKSGSTKVIDIIMERLPFTVILFTTATLVSALVGMYLAFIVSKFALTKIDKVIVPFAILTYVLPAWFLAIFFILLFSYTIPIFPPGGVFSPGVPDDLLLRIADFLWHLSLPMLVWVLASFGYWTYIFRSIFTQLYSETFVMAARARGLPESLIDRKYVLRNAFPPFITMLTLSVVFSIAGAPITEYVFNWEGLGRLLVEAALVGDMPIVVGSVVMFAYILGATVIALEVIHAAVDPRIRAQYE